MTDQSFVPRCRPCRLFACAVAVIAAAWWWLGAPVADAAVAAGARRKALLRLLCAVPRARRARSTPPTHDRALRRSRRIWRGWRRLTDCVRTYSIDFGLDQVAGDRQAARHEGDAGLWLSGNAERTSVEIETAVALAKQFPDVIRAVVVGNEVLLRGEMTAQDLAATIRDVKSAGPDAGHLCRRVGILAAPSRCLRRRSISSPSTSCRTGRTSRSRRGTAAAHVDCDPRDRSRRAFPGKEILIGEIGWPSAGRMREGALPSPANQARVHPGGAGAGKARELPRQRDRGVRPAVEARSSKAPSAGIGACSTPIPATVKFAWGEAGVQSSALAAADRGRRRAGARSCSSPRCSAAFGPKQPMTSPALRWAGVACESRRLQASFVPLAIEKVPLESLGVGGWTRSGILLLLAIGLSARGRLGVDPATPDHDFRECRRLADASRSNAGLFPSSDFCWWR